LWTWLWGRYHVPQNVFLVIKWYTWYTSKEIKKNTCNNYVLTSKIHYDRSLAPTTVLRQIINKWLLNMNIQSGPKRWTIFNNL